MTRRWVLLLIAANLIGLLTLVFVYPHFMVAPGPLITEHADLTTDCFACHKPLRGVRTEKCTVCHAPADIGIKTTKGQTLVSKTRKASFHQELMEQNCMACHSDHAGPKLTRKDRKPFSHALLKPTVREACHSCHKAPENNLHRNVKDSCTQCHSQQGWKPATLNHDKLFLLDGDHKTECVTCHVKADYNQYTCYGCHEHQPDRIRSKHEREGIRNFDNCVKCHRSADDKGEEGDD